MFPVADSIAAEFQESGHYSGGFFLLAVFFYIFYQLALQPNWVLGGEMWAEMATNYFPNANSSSYLNKLFSTDAGYIPAPQRLIALLGNLLNLPASTIPYFYTWSAIILTGVIAGSFCTVRFRILIRSDALRFLASIAILMVADFDTRTFVNFTYFSAFFVAIVTALALVDESEDVPWWAWFIPILMVSKPAVLSALPAMILVAFASKTRFRRITSVVVVLCVGQLLQMVISSKGGVMPFRTNELTLWEKIISSFNYFFGFLGGYISGRIFHLNKYFSIVFGFLVFGLSVFLAFRKNRNPNSLIIVGISLLFFNVLLNSFALSDEWNWNMARLEGLPVYRHIIVGFFGCILIIVGLLANLTESKSNTLGRMIFPVSGPALFCIWFLFSGWFSYATQISKEPLSPTLGNSQWQSMSQAIDQSESSVCVPINPFGWLGGVYGRNCVLLNKSMDSGGVYRSINSEADTYSINFTPPAWVSSNYVIAIGILVRPSAQIKTHVVAKATLISENNYKLEVFGDRELPPTGGLLLLSGIAGSKIRGLNSVKVDFNVPVDVRFISEQPNNSPSAIWMGQPVSSQANRYNGKIVHQPSKNRGKDDGLFFVKEGLRRWIPNVDWIKRNGFEAKDIIEIDPVDFYSIYEDTRPALE